MNNKTKKGGKMNLFKKTILSVLAMMPLGPISYAAEFEKNVDKGQLPNVPAEFERRLLANELPEKYYRYLERQNIVSLEELVAQRNLSHYLRMLKEFEGDLNGAVAATGGAISIGGTF